jgi:hypothetical protein
MYSGRGKQNLAYMMCEGVELAAFNEGCDARLCYYYFL